MTKEPEGRLFGTHGGDDGRDAEVHSITSAAPAHSVDMHQRMVRYSIAMGIRVVCIVALFFLDGWFKLIAVAGAVFLPWVAVVIANAQAKDEVYGAELADRVSYGELGTAPGEDEDLAAQTIAGETVDEDEARTGNDVPVDEDNGRRPGGGRRNTA